MIDTIFGGLFGAAASSDLTIGDFLLCIACTLVIGLILSLGYMNNSKYTKSFVMTLNLLPTVVCVVIMMVNGNIGAGVAVAGAFSLVRFRSIPGSAREITMLFLAMGSGLIVGMGFPGYAFVFAIIMCLFCILYGKMDFGEKKNSAAYKTLTVTIPEDLEHSEAFEDLFREYTSAWELVRVKTANMGTMFKLTYDVTLKDSAKEMEFVNKLRCRNGNLEISVSKQQTAVYQL